MIVQLILYPQTFKGAENPLAPMPQEFMVFNNLQKITQAVPYVPSIFFPLDPQPAPGLPLIQEAINFWDSLTGGIPPNTFDAYSAYDDFSLNWNQYPLFGSNPPFLNIMHQGGGIQKLSNLTVGDLYEFSIIINPLSIGQITIYRFLGTTMTQAYPLSGFGTQSFQWTCIDPNEIIVIDRYDAGATTEGYVASCSVMSITEQIAYIGKVDNGSVICDLYEDEDIPLTLSVDDFKNVAEKVQSYSKSFDLPGTKRNNLIFDLVFDVTRETSNDSGTSNFNAYRKTRAVLKQDGFVIFEGFLKLNEINEKNGELSYSINLYSEVVALKDVLEDRIIGDLDLSELEVAYHKQTIKNSWYSGTGAIGTPLVNPLNVNSYAYDAAQGVNATTVIKFPFVNWANEYAVSTSTGLPKLLNLDNTFRPWLQLRYLINKIFEQTQFSWTSNFFDSTDFGKLYMDFNWISAQVGTGCIDNIGLPVLYANTTFQVIPFDSANSTLPSGANWDVAGNFVSADVDGTTMIMDIKLQANNVSGSPQTEFAIIHRDSAGNLVNSWYSNIWCNNCVPNVVAWNVTKSLVLDAGDYVQFKYYADYASNSISACEVCITVNQKLVGSDLLSQSIRGELGQWDFLKGILTMFNMVSLPDKSDSNNILIEPYGDIFIRNTNSGSTSDLSLASRGIALDWTDKVDATDIKLNPLTDLNMKTNFVWEIDKDDYFFDVYKKSTNHDYGSLEYDASYLDILDGEEEISGKPFAATLSKPLMSSYPNLIIPTIYQRNESGETSSFENAPRICYDNGRVNLGHTYYIPAQNGEASENQGAYGRFSHLSDLPTVTGAEDYLWGQQQLSSPQMGNSVTGTLFNLYWLPYFNELYNADTKTMTLKINLTPTDIATFNFFDTVFIKQREYRVNKIDYKPNDLATVEFILIP